MAREEHDLDHRFDFAAGVPQTSGVEHLHKVLVDVIEQLEARADYYEAQGTAIFNSALVAEELRRHAGRARGLL